MDDLKFFPKEELEFLKTFSVNAHKVFLERINMSEAEYKQLCQPYLKECQCYEDILKTQSNLAMHYKNTLLTTSVKQENSVGGETIHRGFYCPSLIQDIVVGNCKRGKLCKPNNRKITYTYYFDSNDNLIAIRQESGIEFITYKKNTSLGVFYDNDNRIQKISECKYDNSGRIKEYIYALCYNDTIEQLEKEVYTYLTDSVIVENSILFISDLFENEPINLSLNKYIFSIENNYLTSYIVDIFDTEDITTQPLKDRTYKVNIKRKV